MKVEWQDWVKKCGRLNEEQEQALAKFVKGRTVHDLGCGHGELAAWMADQGATVIGVDLHQARVPEGPNLTFHNIDFKDYLLQKPEIEVAVISWPQNQRSSMLALVRLLELVQNVVYVGKNTDGTACGTPELFEHLCRRHLYLHYRDRKNCLHFYGYPNRYGTVQLRNEEEVCGLLNNGRFLPVSYGSLHSDEAIFD